VDDLKTNFRTGESAPEHAARMFIVPITLFSCALEDEVVAESTTRRVSTTVSISACALEDEVVAESTTRRVSTTVSISAASTTRRSSACWAPTFTYSVRSSSTWGSSLSTPTTASTSGKASRAWASRPPQ